MSKKVAVLFSGGLDSTYLVWKNLKDGNTVFPVYIEILNNGNKTILEKNRVELLYNEFKKDFGFNIRSINYAVSAGVYANESSLWFKQMPIWIFGMVYLQSLDVDEIQVGYVMNDDAISHLDDIKRIYKSFQPIQENKMIKLTFPISKKSKWTMASEMPRKYTDLTVTCENPTIDKSHGEVKIRNRFDLVRGESTKILEYTPCCDCVSCKKVISTKYYGIGELPKIYKDSVFNSYIDELNYLGYEIRKNDEKIGYIYEQDLLVAKKNFSDFNQLTIPFEEPEFNCCNSVKKLWTGDEKYEDEIGEDEIDGSSIGDDVKANDCKWIK